MLPLPRCAPFYQIPEMHHIRFRPFSGTMRARMLPLWPEYHPAGSIPVDHVLGVVVFGEPVGTSDLTLSIPIRQLGSTPLAEVWRSGGEVERGTAGLVEFARTPEVMFGVVRNMGRDETDHAAERAYEAIAAASAASHAHLVRVWNHLGDINGDERELERYKRFCAGRHEALSQAGLARECFPAASAVGMSDPGLAVYFVASRAPVLHVENPRQVSAYEYPPVYGPRSPSFARATVVSSSGEALVFVSGTASVVGHETRHAGSVSAQLEETIENLDIIVRTAAQRAGREGSVAAMTVAKIYVRDARDAAFIERRFREAVPGAAVLCLESDICRRDLLLEIEGVARV